MNLTNYSPLVQLFPHFKEPCVIAAATLNHNKSLLLDPEDKIAADAIAKCVSDIQGPGAKVKTKHIPSFGAAESGRHIIALGGGWTNKLNEYIACMPKGNKHIPCAPLLYHKPLLDLYMHIHPTVDKIAIRRFYGKEHPRSLRAVVDERLTEDKIIYAETNDKDNWLEKDYLLITTIHLKCLVPSFDESLFITSFAGLCGPGTMGVDLFFQQFEELREDIFKEKGDNLCFQTLCSLEKINHKGEFSIAEHITHIRTYAITKLQEQAIENDTLSTLQSLALRPTGKTGSYRENKIEINSEEKETDDYVVYLSSSTDIWPEIILDISKKEIEKKYLPNKNNYSIFIYKGKVFVKSGKALKPIKISGIPYRLLIIFLRQKGQPLDSINLYNAAWAWQRRDIQVKKTDKAFSNCLKSQINKLKTLLNDVPDFRIPSERNCGYACEGKFQFCVIVPKHENRKYIVTA